MNRLVLTGPSLAGGLFAIALLACAGAAGAQPTTGTTSSGLVSSPSVPPPAVVQTGIVWTSSPDGNNRVCTGSLVSPVWVLTAQHCLLREGDVVTLGNVDDPTAPRALVRSVANAPLGDDEDYPVDVALVRLETMLIPRRADGQLWTWFQRDIDRRFPTALLGRRVTVYGYGMTTQLAAGEAPTTDQFNSSRNLRVGTFTVLMIEDGFFFLEPDRIAGGDSGAPILSPATVGQAFQRDDQTIIGIIIHGNPSSGPMSAMFRPWFDQTLALDPGPRLPPSMIMTGVLGM